MPTEQQIKNASHFKKEAKTNPSQIRAQFMSQVAGSTASSISAGPDTTTKPTKASLRPTRDVLNRLRFDPAYKIEDFVVGCINRKEGIVEIPVAGWKDQESQGCIAYFKDIRKGEVVWDRVSKTDLLFS